MTELVIDKQIRQCGGCTMCCKNVAVKELEKPSGQWCKHAAIGEGCKIYAERPEGCQVFQCLYLWQPTFPEIARPDKTGVVFYAEQSHGQQMIIAAERHAGALMSSETAQAIVRGYLVRRINVLVYCGPRGYVPALDAHNRIVNYSGFFDLPPFQEVEIRVQGGKFYTQVKHGT